MIVDKFNYKNGKTIIFNTIDDLKEEGKIETGSLYFGYYKKKYSDIINYINILRKRLLDNNFDLQNFFETYENEIFKDADFISYNCFTDSLLYWYDSNKVELGGTKLDGSSEVEYLYKYRYGYYNYEMGRKYIEQSYSSLEEYYKATAENILIGILEPDYSNTNISNLFHINKDQAISIAERTSVIKKFEKGYSLLIHIKVLYLELLKFKNVDYLVFFDALEKDLRRIPYLIHDNILEIMFGFNKSKLTEKEIKDITEHLETLYQANLYNL